MTIKLKYSHGVFYMAIWPYSSKCWSSLWIAVLIFSSWTNPTLTVDEQSKTITENSSSSLNNENQASNLITTPSSQSSSSQSITNIVSTFSYFTSLTSSAIPKSTRLLSSSISSTQHVAMTTLTKLSSPGVDVSSFLTTSPSATPSSSYGVYVSSSQSSVTSSLPLSSISTTDTASSSQIIMSTRTSSTWHGTADVTAVATSSAYTLSPSRATTSYNTITTSAISLSPNKSISHDAMSSSLPSSSRLSASRTSVYLSSSFIVTPSPSVQQTSTTLSSTSILLPETSSSISSVSETSSSISSVFVTSSSVSSVSKTSSFVSSVPMSSWLPGIVSSSTISTTPQLTSMVYSKSSSIMIRSSITSIDISPSSSSAIMSTSIPVVPTTPPVKGPSSPPMNVSAYNIASTSMVVSWQPPPSDTLNGELEKYEVMLEKVAADACSSGSVSSNTATVTSITYVTATLSSTTSPSSSVKLQISSSAGPSFTSSPEAMPSSTMQMTAKSSSTVISTTMPVEPTEPTKPTESPEPPENMASGLNDAGKNLSIILSNLEVLTCYGIQVRAVTTIPGPWSAKLLVKTTPDKPTAPPLDVRATTQSSSSILVSWKPPPLQFRHGLIKNYIIEYYSSNKDDIKVNNTMDNATSITLVHLRPYTKYHITVKAVNSFGAGPASEPVANTTFEDAPSPPTNFTVKSINSTSLFATWRPPTNPNGAVIKYKLYYQQTTFNVSNITLVYDGRPTMFVITGLEKFTNYTLTLFAYNVRYGYNSSSVQAIENTHPSVPTEPRDVKSKVINSTSLKVMWKAPNQLNGVLKFYQVSYRPKSSSSVPAYVKVGLSTSAVLTSLHPFTLYEIFVQAATARGLGPAATVYIATPEGVPGVISYLGSDDVMTDSVTIKWAAPAHPNGRDIGYRLVYGPTGMSKNHSLTFDEADTKAKIGGLVPYTNYTFTISAYNLLSGLSGPPKSITVLTLPKESSPPRNIRFVRRTSNSLSVSWDPPAQPNGEIDHYLLKVFDVDNNQFLESFKVFGLQFTIDSLKPYHEYSVSVSCQNNVGESESSPKVSFYTLPTTPPTIPPIKKPSDSGITENVITIELEKASDSNGKISYYQVIVLELAVNTDGDVIPPDENPDDFTPETLVTYVEAKKQKPKLIPYIAAQFPANFFSKYRHFKVGDGKNFSAKARKRRDTNEQFYNGPLSPSTFYTMFERAAVNKDIYTSSGWTEPVSTSGKAVISKKQSTQGTNVGLVAGVCVALVFLIVIAIILLMLLWKKRRFAFGMLDDEGDYSNRSFKLQKMRGSKRRRTSSRGLMGSTDSLDNLDDLTRRRQPIPVEEFVNHVRRMHIDGDIGFSEEYELVQPDDKEFTWQHSLMPFNKHKNRYANIVAYDHSRVLLTPIEGVAGSDYINANYIDGYSRSGAYIATQGPLPETFDDFWRMIWEQGTASIVMLTQLEERGRRKCDQYWPDRGTQTYGAIRVTASETSHMSYYVLRVFIISHKQDEEEPRQVKQYHFTSWPDHGVPTHPVPLLSLVRTVANANPSTAGPCVVHCSAGVGRTGTYVTLDSVLQRIEKEQTIDVFEFVQQMRTKRNLMVQTESQYIFIHDALVEAVSCGITEFDAKKCSTRIRELREVDPESGRTYMEQEFLRLLKDERHHSTFKAANMGVNSAKNRYLNILPYENTRVSLKMRPGEIGSDYINASYIDGYCRRQVYIATQAPLPGTFEDFWRMVWEQGSCVIVMLTREEEAGKVKCHRYWPSDGTRIFGDVLVELAEEVLYTDYIMREFKLTHTEEKDSRVIRHYQYIGWPDIGLPESGVGLIDLIGQIEKWQQQSNNTIITAHCSGGVGRTGVYCAISILIERVKAEGVIDVFQTVQLLRLQRPAMVQILEQYEFCYSTLQEYLDSFDLYANFH